MPDNLSSEEPVWWCPSRKMDICAGPETRAFEDTDEAPRNCAALSLEVMRVTRLPARPSQWDGYQTCMLS